MKGFTFFAAIVLTGFTAWAGPFTNIDTYKNSLGFSRFYSQENTGRRLKIAVLDKGFFGYEKEIGTTLPSSTRYVAGPVSSPENMHVEHGLRMAQILTSLMTNDLQASQWVPELTLYNVFGFSNLKAAIDDIIARKVDLVLYSEVWEYGGNFDGAGFINHEINRATRNGVIWVNAAGNFALTTFNSGIRTIADNWVQLPDQNNGLMIRCEYNTNGTCPVKIVLSWNDFKNNVDLGTDKDLDLALTDDLLNIVQSSALKQSKDANESRPGFSKYPREIITAELNPGTYFIRVKNRSQNFASNDQLRITVDGDNVIMPSHSRGETLLNPADNATVITVGASDSPRSSSSQTLGKPDLFAPSSLFLNNGAEYRGSSNSAAIVAAGLGILKSQQPKMTRVDLLKAVSSYGGGAWDQRGLSLHLLGFAPTGPGCFIDVNYNPLPHYLREVVSKGGYLVQTTVGIRVIVPFDPITLASHLRRNLMNDMIVALPQGGYAVYPRNAMIPAGAAEIFQRPLEAGLCRITNSGNGKNFRL
ncbi:S8 family serine peptidase [Bdellovibrio bacteriovorus]|uniref:S8 family serine peptidase n=1 Tax=Bdellovibrio bacteriovorus TaxID=959 RepID=UPI0035A60F95